MGTLTRSHMAFQPFSGSASVSVTSTVLRGTVKNADKYFERSMRMSGNNAGRSSSCSSTIFMASPFFKEHADDQWVRKALGSLDVPPSARAWWDYNILNKTN